MAQNKNQHYVPKFYFKLFSKNDKTICVFNLFNEQIIEYASIRGQCSEKYFYSKIMEIEKSFSKLESLLKKMIRKIIENKSLNCLSKEEKRDIKSQILFQYGRTKYAYNRENDMANYFLNLLKPAIYEKAKKEGNISLKSIKDTKIVLNSSHTLLTSMISGILLYDLKMILLENQSKTDFIFSDNPVVFFNSYFNDSYPYGTTGIASTGLQIFYPINSKLMLFLFDTNFYDVKNIDKIQLNKNKDIQRLNGLQVLTCENNLYFEDISQKAKIIEIFNQLKQKKPKDKNEFEIMGNRIAEDGTYRELLRTSSPKLHYNIEKLSFLKHKDTGVKYGVRNPQILSFVGKLREGILNEKITSINDLSEFLRL